MGLNRIDIINRINTYSLNNNKVGLIELLCDILDNEDYIEKYFDLVNIIIDIGELYGYQEYLNEHQKNIINHSSCTQLRMDMYTSKYNEKFKFNSGQLSLLEELNLSKRIFVSAPTSFGKTSMIFEHIFNNYTNYNNICIIVPTNALEEELFNKFLNFNKTINKKYTILTTPHNNIGNNIFILTPEKYLLLNENNTIKLDLIVIDESYKIENTDDEIENKIDSLNTRSSKYRMVFELISKSDAKIIFLSPYTYNKSESMNYFFEKYGIKTVDRPYNYVQHRIEDISTQTKARVLFDTKDISFKSDGAGIKKAISILPYLEENTIIYIMYPAEVKKILPLISNDISEQISTNSRFKSFYEHLENNYVFEDSKWYVLEALKKGIGLYISPIPRYIKKEILNLFNNGYIKILIVTTAFAEGVNSSAKNIIITNQIAGANKKMSNLDLLNLGGRAGRFGKYSKGYIYTATNEISERMVESEKNGVTISNSNYEFPPNNIIRSDYEIDIIDDEWLNAEEREIKNNTKERMENLNLTDEDLNIALCTSRNTKIDLFEYFTINNNLEIDELRYKNVCNLLSNNRSDVVNSLKSVFDELKNAGISIYPEKGEMPAYNKNGEFIWGIFYGIHSSGNIKEILKRRKNYIISELNKIIPNLYELDAKEIDELLKVNNKLWISEFLSDGEVDDFKLYNNAFKFIANIIEYRIPFYIGLYVSVFKLYCLKNKYNFEFDFDVIDISNSLENKNIDKKYDNMIEFGIPIDTIKKLSDIDKNKTSIALDDYEKIMLQEYNDIYNE